MASDTLVTTHAACETLSDFSYPSVLPRYTVVSGTVAPGYPDRNGRCLYSDLTGEVFLSSFTGAPSSLGSINMDTVAAEISLVTDVISGEILDVVAADSGANLGTFSFGPNEDAYSGTIHQIQLHEQNSEDTLALTGSLVGSFKQVRTIGVAESDSGSAGFQLVKTSDGGLTGQFQVSLPDWAFQISSVSGTRIARTYCIGGWYGDTVLVHLANYLVNSSSSAPVQEASGASVAGHFLKLSENIEAPTDQNVSFVPGEGATKFEYDLLKNTLSLSGETNVGVRFPLQHSWLGLSSSVTASTTPLNADTAWVRLLLQHYADGSGAMASYSWDDISLAGKLNLYSLVASDVVLDSGKLGTPGFTGSAWLDSLGLDSMRISAKVQLTSSKDSKTLSVTLDSLYMGAWSKPLTSSSFVLGADSATFAYGASASLGDSKILTNLGLAPTTNSTGASVLWRGSAALSSAGWEWGTPQGLIAFADSSKLSLSSTTSPLVFNGGGEKANSTALKFGRTEEGETFHCTYAYLPASSGYWGGAEAGLALGDSCAVSLGSGSSFASRTVSLSGNSDSALAGRLLLSLNRQGRTWSGEMAVQRAATANAAASTLVGDSLTCATSTTAWPGLSTESSSLGSWTFLSQLRAKFGTGYTDLAGGFSGDFHAPKVFLDSIQGSSGCARFTDT
ncbi:MAG TPA: hypothetical protein VLM37_07890, partial [Fibrobacteraceae bacterium]|nr:hypothetical protein [Fibrobacteraceae bacterium]